MVFFGMFCLSPPLSPQTHKHTENKLEKQTIYEKFFATDSPPETIISSVRMQIRSIGFCWPQSLYAVHSLLSIPLFLFLYLSPLKIESLSRHKRRFSPDRHKSNQCIEAQFFVFYTFEVRWYFRHKMFSSIGLIRLDLFFYFVDFVSCSKQFIFD